MEFWDAYFFWRDAIIAASIGAVLLSYLGFFIVLTRNAFVSAAVSNLAGLGVVVAIFIGASGGGEESGTLPLLVGIGFGVVGTTLLLLPQQTKRLSSDAVLAAVVVAATAFASVFAHYLTTEYQHVRAALFGDTVVSTVAEVVLLSAVSLFVAVTHWAFRQRFWLIVFDPDAARAQGMRLAPWGLLLGLTIGLSLSVTTRALGALPAFSFSVVPAATGLLLASRLRTAITIAVGVGLISAFAGYYISFMKDMATGPTMVAVSLTFLLLAAGGRAARRVIG